MRNFNLQRVLLSLADYQFAIGEQLDITLSTSGSVNVVGLSPYTVVSQSEAYFAGRTLVFTEVQTGLKVLKTLCHELTHALGMAHRCARFDFSEPTSRSPHDTGHRCCMSYFCDWIIDEDGQVLKWNRGLPSAHHCHRHIAGLRRINLGENPALGW